ncbi:unnamed protein product [Darwinula stevensoni]|uniref:Transcription initiation factor IIE subunit beta n=1 Tax=Darwinula stevensoni TaxID=69355 RepID=A0A7R8X2N7_9CRUS|nr:unnamed protein product [Darwinula stevensoni]CAG0881665.1 unnamed protein product [Darwinula stevensoni]
MDPALKKEHAAFKKRALATPSVEKKKAKSGHASAGVGGENRKKASAPASAPVSVLSYKGLAGSSQYRFTVLARIVKFMKQRHLEGDAYPLTLEQILDETSQLDWLLTEALKSNPKIEEVSDGAFVFKPPYKIENKKSLLSLLKKHDLKGFGGILLEDIQESLPKSDKCLKQLGSEVLYVTRPIDKKQIVFYNDRSADFAVDEEFQKLWRSVAVDGIDDKKIEEYLEKHGIRFMQDNGAKKAGPILKRKKGANRKKVFKKPRDNEHLGDILETYE